MNVLVSGKAREGFNPHIQRRFPINPAVLKLLWSPRSAERKEGVRLLASDHPSREALQEHLRLRILDRNPEVSVSAIKTAMERQVFDPITAAAIFRLSDSNDYFDKEKTRTAKDYAIAILPFSQYADAVNLLRSSLTLDFEHAFAGPAKLAGIRLSPKDWQGIRFALIDVMLLFEGMNIPREVMEPEYIISKIQTRQRLEPSLYELSATQGENPLERAAAIALLRELPKQERPREMVADISSSQESALIGLRDHMQSSVRAWLRDNYTLPLFLFEDPNVDTVSLYINAFMMLFQRSIARGYCMHLNKGPIKPAMLLFLSAIDNEIRATAETMQVSLGHILNSDEHIQYLQDDNFINKETGLFKIGIFSRASLLKAMTGNSFFFADNVVDWFNSNEPAKILAALAFLGDMTKDAHKVIGPYVNACFGERYDYQVTKFALPRLEIFLTAALPEQEANNIRAIAVGFLKRHPEFVDQYLEELEKGSQPSPSNSDPVLFRHTALCMHLRNFMGCFGNQRQLLKQVRDLLTARCKKAHILAAIDDSFDDVIDKLDHPNRRSKS